MLAPIADALPPFVRHVELPTPFPVGPVNCYLLVDDPVTLVDPGLLFDDTVDRIHALLASAGRVLGEVERVVVTHAHPDHFGAAGWVAAQGGGRIVAGAPEVEKLLHGFDREDLYEVVDRLGVPADVLVDLPEAYGAVFDMVEALDADVIDAVDDGDTVHLGGLDFQALVTPGHAKGHLSLFDASGRVLLSGDHLLPRITPNPVMEPDADCALGRRQSLVEYLASLDRFVALDPAVVLPGHGPAFTSVDRLVEGVRVHHEERLGVIRSALRRMGTASAYEVAAYLFPEERDFGVLLAVSEVVGHLDVLVERGVADHDGGHPLRYEACSKGG